MTKQTKTKEGTLVQLAEKINLSHQKCLQTLGSTLEHARHTGGVLLEAKEKVTATGKKWLEWVQENCKFSVAEAQRYMRVANHYGALLEQNKDLKKLSLTQALRLLSPPEKAGKGRRSTTRPFSVASEAEVKHLARQAEDLRLPDESAERRFLDGTVAAVAQKILEQARKTHLTDDEGKALSPAEVAVALLERLKEALYVGLVVRAKAANPQRSDTPANGHRVNGRQHAAV